MEKHYQINVIHDGVIGVDSCKYKTLAHAMQVADNRYEKSLTLSIIDNSKKIKMERNSGEWCSK